MLTRGVIGIGIGLSSATVPTYLAELAPARVRGALGSLNQLFIVSGILIAFLVDYALSSHNNWKGMFLGALIPAAILLVGLMRAAGDPALAAEHGTGGRGPGGAGRDPAIGDEAELDAEIADIRDVIRRDSEDRGRARDLCQPWVRPMVLVAMILAIGQQFSGVNAINAYFPTMLKSLGFATRTALLVGGRAGRREVPVHGVGAVHGRPLGPQAAADDRRLGDDGRAVRGGPGHQERDATRTPSAP